MCHRHTILEPVTTNTYLTNPSPCTNSNFGKATRSSCSSLHNPASCPAKSDYWMALFFSPLHLSHSLSSFPNHQTQATPPRHYQQNRTNHKSITKIVPYINDILKNSLHSVNFTRVNIWSINVNIVIISYSFLNLMFLIFLVTGANPCLNFKNSSTVKSYPDLLSSSTFLLISALLYRLYRKSGSSTSGLNSFANLIKSSGDFCVISSMTLLCTYSI